MVTYLGHQVGGAEVDLPNRKPGVGAGRLVGLSGDTRPGGLPECAQDVVRESGNSHTGVGVGRRQLSSLDMTVYLPQPSKSTPAPPNPVCLYNLSKDDCALPCCVPAMTTVPHPS